MLELSGVNIILREFGDSNLYDARYLSWLRDIEVMRLINRPEYLVPIAFEEVVKYVKHVKNSPQDEFFAIYTKSNQEFIGTLRLSEIDRRICYANIGIMIGDKSYWGKGLAKDAVAVITDYAFNQLGLRKMGATCLSANVAMCKCFERLGFQKEGVLRGHSLIDGQYLDRNVYGLFREEFKSFVK